MSYNDDGFDIREKYQSQIPAMQLLVAMGFRPLSQEEALRLRGGRLRNVTLDDVLAEQLLKVNRFEYRGREYAFDLEDAHEAIRGLKPTPERIKGLRLTNQDACDTLVLGATVTKTIGGDSKSYSFRYVDWENPENNVFHVTAELSVERTASVKTKRCDIVGYVNGIPFIVIENKRPTESLKKAKSQLIRYQNEDAIPHLFHLAQMLLVMNRQDARYATVGTPAKFWQVWREQEDTEEAIAALANRSLSDEEKAAIFSGDFAPARPFFEAMAAAGPRALTEQDRTLYGLCRPARLLDLVRRFTVFEGGVRIIARHPQYFGILAAIERVKQMGLDGARKGGVVWHTQGSGKSLTMVMLAKALAMEKEAIPNSRIVIVTDRDDLDRQIKGTFKTCDMEPVRARSGAHLGDLIRDRTPLITTIVNKFERALQAGDVRDEDHNIFVLVDESHRTQTGRYGGYSQFAGKMRRMLPKACYLGFTGTPLITKHKRTTRTFGGFIGKPYTIRDAVDDGAIVPLLYEGRMVDQQVSGDAIDRWFDKISRGLTDQQRADLRRKYSHMDQLRKTAQTIRAKAFDISEHYRQHWQGTGFKAQLVAPSKASAIRFKEVLDEIGHVTSEIIISAPSENEGNEEVDVESRDLVRRFWDDTMKRFDGEEEYNRQITNAFKGSGDPEILIVVSKLLTGFNAPRNTVLYVCKPLKEHNLLQAIARVNRLYEDEEEGMEKEFGHIIDYEGLLGELDTALSTYDALAQFDQEDLEGTVLDVRSEIRRLSQLHDQLWDLFKEIRNRKDMEQFEQLLFDEAIRRDFYHRLRAFSRCLHISLSSDKLLDVYTEEQVDRMKRDWKTFTELRRAVQLRYQETVDVKEFEPKIARLLDDHVIAMPAETIIEPVNINDPDALRAVVGETGVSEASRADRIASASRRVITERMEQDPALYQSFRELLEETIRDYRARRISEREYLERVTDLAGRMARRERRQYVPDSIRADEDAQAFYGILDGRLKSGGEKVSGDELARIALDLILMIRKHHIVGVWSNDDIKNRIRNAIDDYCFDVLRDERSIDLTVNLIDELQRDVMRLAQARFPG